MEQPIGTGFSQGNVTATSEEDVAAQFMSWFKNFADTFGMQGYKVYLTGESYAGMYVPYIAAAMLDANEPTYYNVSGILIYDPSIAWNRLQTDITVFPFAEYWDGEWKRPASVSSLRLRGRGERENLAILNCGLVKANICLLPSLQKDSSL